MSALRSTLPCAVLLGLFLGAPLTFGGKPTDRVRGVIERSIPYIQEQGVSWINEKKCVTCHRVNTMIWSLSESRRHGFEVSESLGDWVDWAADASLSKDDNGRTVGLGNKEGVAQIVLTLGRDQQRNKLCEELARLLLEEQRPNGSWAPSGQLPLQKRSKRETTEVSTMWITLALISQGASRATNAAVDEAMRFIEQSKPGESTEWRAVRLLLAVACDDHNTRESETRRLLRQQQPDGGWGWLQDGDSDALATGFALYALYALINGGLAREDAAVIRAQQFLVKTQREDGSWAVHGTKADKQDGVEETAVYWGTTWASLGLLASLPAPD